MTKEEKIRKGSRSIAYGMTMLHEAGLISLYDMDDALRTLLLGEGEQPEAYDTFKLISRRIIEILGG